MAAINIKTAKQIEPKCYAYTTPEIKRHDGWTKSVIPSKMMSKAYCSTNPNC